MTRKKLVRDDLLYHSAHGLCCVDRVTKENHSGKETLSYALVPKSGSRMKVRFVISESDIETSGFHPLISQEEANKILAYLKAGDISACPPDKFPKASSPVEHENHPWGLAKGILSFSQHEPEIRDQKKRQILERSARGLVGEFALVFKASIKESSAQILKSLGRSRINPAVLAALEEAGRKFSFESSVTNGR